MRTLTVAFVAVLMTIECRGEVTRSAHSWSVSPPFGKSIEARKALSGAACVAGTNHCIIVNDEKKYLQFFDISGRMLVPGRIMRLLADTINGEEMKEIDAEGASYAAPEVPGGQGYFYVVGSHGLSRKGAKFRKSSFNLFRFPVDGTNGLPSFDFGEDVAAPQIERTALLRETIRRQPALAQFAEARLDSGGVTIEGIATHGDRLLLGMRGPSKDGTAYVLSVARADLFKDAVPPAIVMPIHLGRNVGIRDLAAVSDGVLILAGRSDEGGSTESRPQGVPTPSIWHWDVRGDKPTHLGKLPDVTSVDKAEAMVVLKETKVAYRILVMFDGVLDGGPTEYDVGR